MIETSPDDLLMRHKSCAWAFDPTPSKTLARTVSKAAIGLAVITALFWPGHRACPLDPKYLKIRLSHSLETAGPSQRSVKDDAAVPPVGKRQNVMAITSGGGPRHYSVALLGTGCRQVGVDHDDYRNLRVAPDRARDR